MADNIIKNINLSDGTKADFNAKYWNGFELSQIAEILENKVKFSTINGNKIFGGEDITIDNTTIEDVNIKGTDENEIIVSVNGKDSEKFTVPYAIKSSYTEHIGQAPKLNIDESNKIYISVGENDKQIKSEPIIVPYATTAKCLVDKPEFNKTVDESTSINITVGGKTSEDFTVPYATTAGSANEYTGDLDLEYNLTNYTLKVSLGEDKFDEVVIPINSGGTVTIGEVKISSDPTSPNDIKVSVDGISSTGFTVPYATTAGSATIGSVNISSGSTTNTIKVSVDGTASNDFTVPYATTAGSANECTGKLSLGYDDTTSELTVSLGTNISNKLFLPTNSGSGTATIGSVSISNGSTANTIKVSVNGTGSGDFTVPYATTAGSANEYTGELSLGYDNKTGLLTVSLGDDNSANVSLPINSGSSTIEMSEENTNTNNFPILFKGSDDSIKYDNEENGGFKFNPSKNYVYASGFFETSDGSLKDIVNPIVVDLDKLSKFRKVYFTWKDNQDSDLQIGMIAQDVKEIYPELVSENNGKLSLAYDRLSVIALEAIDVLHRENNELKTRIEKLESLVNQLIKNN